MALTGVDTQNNMKC